MLYDNETVYDGDPYMIMMTEMLNMYRMMMALYLEVMMCMMTMVMMM